MADTVNITLPTNNLYRNGEIILLNDGSGDQLLLRETVDWQEGINDEYYTVKQDDELSLIAYQRYKNRVSDASKYWWVIADANQIIEPLDLTDYIGKDILIPDITTFLLQLNNT